MTPETRRVLQMLASVFAALEAGEEACRKCGGVTFYGVTLPMLDEDAAA